VGRRIESGDVVDARFTGDEVLPESVLTDAVGGDDTQPGNDYTTWVLHLPVPLSEWNGEGGITSNNLAENQSKPKSRPVEGSGRMRLVCGAWSRPAASWPRFQRHFSSLGAGRWVWKTAVPFSVTISIYR